jgi:hypothetical protein
MMKACVVSIQDQIHAAALDPEQALELVEGCAGVPQTHEIRGADKQDPVSVRQSCTMCERGGFDADQLWTDVDNHPLEPMRQLIDESLDHGGAEACAHLALGRTTQEHGMAGARAKWLQLVGKCRTPQAWVVADGVGEGADIAARVSINVCRDGRRTQVQLHQHSRRRSTQRAG